MSVRLEALYDTAARLLQKRKEEWYIEREHKASVVLQMCVRKFIRIRRMMKKISFQHKVAYTHVAMAKVAEKGRVKKSVYKQDLMRWYLRRKMEYDDITFNELQTVDAKMAIITRRDKLVREARERAAVVLEAKLQKAEEERIEAWIRNWELKIKQRVKAKRHQVRAPSHSCIHLYTPILPYTHL